jgi:non-specific serine/threonine protein kinase
MHYLTLTETALHHLTGPAQGAWLARLDVERENILAAHAFCDLATDGVTLGFRLVHAAKPYWVTRGLWELGYRLGKEALARTRPDDRSVEHCRALFDTGQLACWLGHYRDAQAYLDESLALARALGDSRRIAAALQPLGAACLGQGDVSAARKHLEEAVTLARGQADPHDLAAALTAMAQLLRAQNDVAAAVPLYEQVLDVARSIDDRELIALGSLNLAMAIIDGNASDRVPPMLLEVFALADETGSKPVAQSALEVAAGLAASRGDWQRAARLYGAAEAHAARTGIHRDPADEGFLRPQIDKARHAMGEPAFRAAEAVGRALGYDDARAETSTWLSGSRLTTPDYP